MMQMQTVLIQGPHLFVDVGLDMLGMEPHAQVMVVTAVGSLHFVLINVQKFKDAYKVHVMSMLCALMRFEGVLAACVKQDSLGMDFCVQVMKVLNQTSGYYGVDYLVTYIVWPPSRVVYYHSLFVQ